MEILWSDKKRWLLFGLPLTFTKYTCTSEKFLIDSGFLSKREDEIRLYRIMDLSVQRSLFQRMFGLGTITAETVDKTCPHLIIKNVKDAVTVKELISEAVEKERVRKRVTSRENMVVDHDCDDYEGMEDFDHDND